MGLERLRPPALDNIKSNVNIYIWAAYSDQQINYSVSIRKPALQNITSLYHIVMLLNSYVFIISNINQWEYYHETSKKAYFINDCQ